MNAMSALYHIAQSDSPSLAPDGDWSVEFREFVNVSLAKLPSNRPTATECLAVSVQYT